MLAAALKQARALSGARLLHSTRVARAATPRPQISLGKHSLRIQFSPSAASDLFPYTWLRDSDPQLIHPSTRQKLHSSVDVPLEARIASARLTQDGTHLSVTWEENTAAGTSSKWPRESVFPLDILQRHADLKRHDAFHHAVSPIPWTSDNLLQSADLFLSYTSLHAPAGLLRGLEQLTRYGILFVTNVPYEETSDDRCELSALAQLFSEIRETFYGRVWDVRSKGEESRNIAYTNLDLGLHMDLQYLENPPRYQILHMLRNRGVQDGESIFSDSLHAAYSLRDSSRLSYDVLCESAVGFHYLNDSHHLYREHPTIELSGATRNSDVAYINYSPPFQSPLPLHTARDVRFLPALKEFTTLIHAPERLYEFAMREGVAVMFDNRRVLHGRREFTNATAAAQCNSTATTDIQRWLKGCYLEADGVMDRLRTLRDAGV